MSLQEIKTKLKILLDKDPEQLSDWEVDFGLELIEKLRKLKIGNRKQVSL